MLNNNTTGFKIKFDIRDYVDILPLPPEDVTKIINHDKPTEECYWQRELLGEITPELAERETERLLKIGVWIYIKKQLIWLPPNYYFFLQYGVAGGNPPEFRLKRLKHVYFKLRVRNNPKALGTYTIKNRQDGETTMAIHDALWECLDGNMNIGQIGIQSKTNEDAKNPCWLTVETLWQGLPEWFKELFYEDFASKNAMAEKLKFVRPKSEEKESRNIVVAYYPSVHNAMDGKNNVRRCILDEVNKWRGCSFFDTLINYKKFIAVGSSRRGLFDIFSSPSDTNGKHNDEAKAVWDGSNPDEITETGSTATRLFRYYSNPLDGLEGFYDRFGDADPDEIIIDILAERNNMPEDKRLGEVRAFPLNEAEMFGSFDNNNATWSNAKGIIERMEFLTNRRFKDDETKEPILVYGNLVWKDNIPDNPAGVEFRQADVEDYDLEKARFAFSYLPRHNEELKWVFRSDFNGFRPLPPRISEYVTGIDPVDKRYATQGSKGISNGSMVSLKYLDLDMSALINVPTVLYSCRPQHVNTFFEDAIKLAIYMQSMVQVESKNTKIVDWFEDRGYMDWLLSKRGEPQSSKNKGDAPSGQGGFLNEMISLIDAATNIPLTEDDPYYLENIWHFKLLSGLMYLDPKNTQKSDEFNAWGQALIGKTKLIKIKPNGQNITFNKAFLAFAMS